MTPVSRGLSFAAGKVRVGRCRLGAEETRRAVFQMGAEDEGQCTQPAQGQDCRSEERRHHVLIEIGSGVVVTASITNEAVADLQLKKGDDAWAVIKASDVMIGK